ncbi:MAG TPA: SDR family oxidoreductase [Methylomirabilota bacterium]|nr:SDR family oxidoreductase [Methylomirabilota bacterium]
MGTVLVTGADRGIGQALCLELHKRGQTVIAACLEDSPMLAGLGIRVERHVDVTSDTAVKSLATRLAGARLDVLINNAGVLRDGRLGALDFADLRSQFEVNALGPLRVTEALLPCLGPGSKVAIITSRVGSLTDNTSGGLYGYRMSKAAANMAGVSLARDLKERGIAVILLHPGMVRTQLTQGMEGTFIEPEEAARGLLGRIDELTLESTGSFRHANGEFLPW